MAENSIAVSMNTLWPVSNSWVVVTCLLSDAMITTIRQGLSTTPMLPDMAVAANASGRRAPLMRISW